MPRLIQNQLLLAKQQSAQGTDAAPAAATDAVLVQNVEITYDQKLVNRPLIRGFYGADDQLPTVRQATVKFTVDLQGSGTAGTAPAWGKLVVSAAAAEAILATPARVEYTPVSTGRKWMTLWLYKDGILYKFQDCMCTFVATVQVEDTPMLEFTFNGLIATAPAAAAVPAGTVTAWQRPLAASPANTGKLNLGGTYATGAITGGTSYDFKLLQFDTGNDVQRLSLITTETLDIFNRSPKLKVVLDLTAANEATYLGNFNTGTSTTLSVLHGTAAGLKVGLFYPNCLITKMSNEANGNMFLVGMELTVLPTAAGNDDWRIFLP